MTQPLCIDLCCGLGGVADGFLAAGYRVVGYDVTDHGYPGELILQDVREVDSIVAQWQGQDITVLWASPPCDGFARWDMPWTRRRGPPPPDLSIVNACHELNRRLGPKVFVLENVRGAQQFLGKAVAHRGPHYFWGNFALMPGLLKYRSKESLGSARRLERARIPFDLSYGLALACRGGA